MPSKNRQAPATNTKSAPREVSERSPERASPTVCFDNEAALLESKTTEPPEGRLLFNEKYSPEPRVNM